MVRGAVLFGVTVLALTGVTLADVIQPHDATATKMDTDDPPADALHYSGNDDDNITAESHPLLPNDQVLLTAGTEGRPQRRRRPGGKRRRLPLDPERLRLIIKRRQNLGLPVRKLVRAQQALIAYEEQIRAQLQESAAVDTKPVIPTSAHTLVISPPRTRPLTTTTTTTTTPVPAAVTTTSTPRGARFPSFSTDTRDQRFHHRVKGIRGRWGLKTSVVEEDGEQEEEAEVKEDEKKTMSSTTLTSRSLSARRRGLAKVLKRPARPQALVNYSRTPTPTLKPSPVTVMSEDKRLRYRPVLARKKKLKKQDTTTSSSSYSVTTESPISGLYELDPYGHSESTNHEGLKTKPRHTPVPKKVVLDHVLTTTDRYFQDLQEPSYFPEEPIYSILRLVSTPQNTAHTTASPVYTTGAPTYDSDDPLDIMYDLAEHASPAYVLAPNFAPEQVSFASHAQPQQSYDHEPAFVPEPAYSIEPEYSSQPAFDPKPTYDHDHVYTPEPTNGSTYGAKPEYNDHLDYLLEEDDVGARIFDQYKYGYSVASEDTGNYHARSEARDGETVSGSYKVALPDGRVQVVTYIADEQGFRAEVTYEGEGTLFTTTPVPPHSSSRPPIYASAFSPAQKVPDDFHTHQADAKALSPSTSLHLRQPSVNHPRRPAPQPVRHQFNGHDQPIHQAPIHTPPPTPASHHSGAPTPPHHSRTFSPQPIHNSTSTTPNQNLHFGDHFHVTTASPNPFRLVVDKSRASTLSPLPFEPVLPPSPFPFSSSSSSYPSPLSSFRNSQRNQATTTPTPPTPTSKSAHDASVPPAFEAPFAATARPITNAHVTDNGFRSTESSTTKSPLHSLHHQTTSTTPKSTTNAHTIAPAHRHSHPPLTTATAPPPANLYKYDPTGREVGAHTTLYNPDPDSRAYIHALGQAHAVPLLLPFSPPHPEGDEARTHPPHNVLPPPPRTYYLSQSSHSIPAYAPTAAPEIVRHLTPTPAHRAKSVEITRGDDQRPRISIKVPEPHEADIYPAPRPRLRLR